MYKLHELQSLLERVFIFNQDHEKTPFRIEVTMSSEYVHLYLFEDGTAIDKSLHPMGRQSLRVRSGYFFNRCEVLTKDILCN